MTKDTDKTDGVQGGTFNVYHADRIKISAHKRLICEFREWCEQRGVAILDAPESHVQRRKAANEKRRSEMGVAVIECAPLPNRVTVEVLADPADRQAISTWLRERGITDKWTYQPARWNADKADQYGIALAALESIGIDADRDSRLVCAVADAFVASASVRDFHLLWTRTACGVWVRLLCRDVSGREHKERFDELCGVIEHQLRGMGLALLDRVVSAHDPASAWRKAQDSYEGGWVGNDTVLGSPAISLDQLTHFVETGLLPDAEGDQ